jgi:hypothetical protein
MKHPESARGRKVSGVFDFDAEKLRLVASFPSGRGPPEIGSGIALSPLRAATPGLDGLGKYGDGRQEKTRIPPGLRIFILTALNVALTFRRASPCEEIVPGTTPKVARHGLVHR